MKLYVCWSDRAMAGRHVCGNACEALKDAGHKPEVIRSYGWHVLPGIFNRTRGRREVKELTGSYTVPVLVTDGGEVVTESKAIIEWAKANPNHNPN